MASGGLHHALGGPCCAEVRAAAWPRDDVGVSGFPVGVGRRTVWEVRGIPCSLRDGTRCSRTSQVWQAVPRHRSQRSQRQVPCRHVGYKGTRAHSPESPHPVAPTLFGSCVAVRLGARDYVRRVSFLGVLGKVTSKPPQTRNARVFFFFPVDAQTPKALNL